MPKPRFSRRIVVLGLVVWIRAAFATASRAQFLKSGKTAPAPEFQGVTQWINSEPLTSNWDAWNIRYWPTVYVVDRRGRVRYGWEGELSYKGAPGEETVRKLIDALLLERP